MSAMCCNCHAPTFFFPLLWDKLQTLQHGIRVCSERPWMVFHIIMPALCTTALRRASLEALRWCGLDPSLILTGHPAKFAESAPVVWAGSISTGNCLGENLCCRNVRMERSGACGQGCASQVYICEHMLAFLSYPVLLLRCIDCPFVLQS